MAHIYPENVTQSTSQQWDNTFISFLETASTEMNSTEWENITTESMIHEPDRPGDGTELDEEFDYLISYNISFRYIAPIIIFSGIVGNILSILVLQGRYFRRAPSSFILSALAVADAGVLCSGIMRHWISAMTDGVLDIRSLTLAGCKLHVFFTYFFPHLSSWSLTLMTLERLVSVISPFKAKQIISRSRMIQGWVITAIILAAFNAHAFKTVTLNEYPAGDGNETDTYLICEDAEETIHFATKIWPWIDLALISLIPVFIIFISNIIIVVFVVKASKLRQDKMQVKTNDDSSSITAMLLAISIVFLLTTTPASIYFIYIPYWPYETAFDIHKVYITYSVVNLLYYLGTSTNFLMYCLTGSHFRRALLATLCCRHDLMHEKSSQMSMSSNVSRAPDATRVTSACEVNIKTEV